MEQATVDLSDGVHDFVFNNKNEERPPWKLFGQVCPRSALVFFLQSIMVVILVLFSIINITLSTSCENTTVWVAILSSSVGYYLPSPKL